MRTIEEFEVSGTIDNVVVEGKVTGFMYTIKRYIPKGLKMTNLKSIEVNKKVNKAHTPSNTEDITLQQENLMDNVKNITKNQLLVKKIVTGALIVAMSTTFTGCKIKPLANTETHTIEQTYEEQTAKIDYFVMAGDTLEGIVRRYKDSNINNEIYNICVENEIQNSNQINSGTFIKLNVPISKLENFDYTYSESEVLEVDAMEHFIYSALNPENVHPDNVVFWRDRQIVLGESNLNPHEIVPYESEKPLIYSAINAKEDLNEMKLVQVGFYSEEDIANKEREMMSYYLRAIEIAENLTGKKYGEDYILQPEVVAIPVEKSFNK